MIANYKQTGDSIDYTPAADVSAGDVIVLGDLVTIANLDIKAGELGALATCGVFSATKAAGEISRGEKLFWDADGDPVGGEAGSGAITTVAYGNIYCGKALFDAAADEQSVTLRLEQPSFQSQSETQGDSEATTIAALVADFNALLTKLKAAGLMA
ncbi:MAG: capsid cement protein [Sedimentisphaeraceae bacterium JB056]